MKNITILCSSNNNNLKLAKEFETYFNDNQAKATIIDLVELDLPLYTSKIDNDEARPSSISKYVDILTNSQGVVVVAPEYNGSVPPTLINFIAWISRSGSEDWRSCFNEKPAIVATHSGGGGAHALMAMRAQLSFIGMNVLGREILTNFQKPLNTDSLKSVCDQLMRIA